jgi:DNA transformation protein
MPQRLYDDPDELAQWAGRALAAAQRKAKPKSTGRLTVRRRP